MVRITSEKMDGAKKESKPWLVPSPPLQILLSHEYSFPTLRDLPLLEDSRIRLIQRHFTQSPGMELNVPTKRGGGLPMRPQKLLDSLRHLAEHRRWVYGSSQRQMECGVQTTIG